MDWTKDFATELATGERELPEEDWYDDVDEEYVEDEIEDAPYHE